MYMADNDCSSEKTHALRPLRAEACTCRIAFGPRAGERVLVVQGVTPMQAGFKQDLCTDMDGFSLHPAATLQRLRLPSAGGTVPPHRLPGTGQLARTD